MPFLNEITNSPNRLCSASNENCASCAAAGAVSLIRYSHSSITSGAASDYAKAIACTGYMSQFGTSVAEQCKNIIGFVQKNTNRLSFSSEEELSLVAATQQMKSHPPGTVFVIFAKGPLISTSREHVHYLNAFNCYGNINYIDFQTNRDARTNYRGTRFASFIGNEAPSTSNSPFVGVVTQALAETRSELHSPTQPGTFIASAVRLRVMAFPPLLTR